MCTVQLYHGEIYIRKYQYRQTVSFWTKTLQQVCLGYPNFKRLLLSDRPKAYPVCNDVKSEQMIALEKQ